ncbi:MAG TPA: ATP synthase subunit I, partial [Clostridiales bacterium]|nr:ATP synthase subunit I [Clostridiales bacterium]
MKLQPASRKELTRITLGTAVCDGILIAVLFVLSLVGVGTFDLFRILLGTVCGTVVAVANFAILCLTVQSATEIDNKKKMKARFQRSYNLR